MNNKKGANQGGGLLSVRISVLGLLLFLGLLRCSSNSGKEDAIGDQGNGEGPAYPVEIPSAPAPTGSVPPAPLKMSPTIGAGNRHTCVLSSRGKVFCWGDNSTGQLGSARPENIGTGVHDLENLIPLDFGPDFIATKLFVGPNHNCVINLSGNVKCWGLNDRGQLGLGETENHGNRPNQMGNALSFVAFPNDHKAVHLSLGNTFSCAALDSGSVVCWGQDNPKLETGDSLGPGILGRGSVVINGGIIGDASGEMGDNLAAVNLGSDFFAIKVASGLAATCALSKAKRVKCWGSNRWGQLGRDSVIPTAVGEDAATMGDIIPYVDFGRNGNEPSGVADIFGAGGHMCIITDKGSSKCWGEATYGLYGLGSYASSETDDSMWYDIIGDGIRINEGSELESEMGDSLRATNWGAGRSASQLALSWGRMCGILAGGAGVRCYGLNRYDQSSLGGGLGIGRNGIENDLGTTELPRENQGALPHNSASNALDVIMPQALPRNMKAVSVATSSYDHTCVLFENEQFICFGDNQFGAAGTGLLNTGLDHASMLNLPIRTVPSR